MSDVSETLQVRTNTPDSTIARLKELGFNGFVFRGEGGWLTVVPYGGPAGLHMPQGALQHFAAQVGAPVALFQTNDFGWGFELALPDGRATAFTRLSVDMAQFGLPAPPPSPPVNESVLAVVVPVARARPFLHPERAHRGDALESEEFAKAMGFAQFEFLSPITVTDDPAEARRRGGIEIGSRPASIRGHASP